MGKFLPRILISLSLLVGSASAQTGGRDLYVAKCTACHARDGSGNNTIGRSLSLNDIRPAIQRMTDEQLREIVLQGKGKMPPLKKLEDEKLRSLILFLRDLAAGNPDTGRAVAEAQAQPLPNVKEVFRDKCSACHAQDGTGRTTIGKSQRVPDLTSAVAQTQNDKELAKAISAGKGRMPGYAKAFNPVQVNQLVSYIRALAKHAGETKPSGGTISTSLPQSTPRLPTPIVGEPKSAPPSPPVGTFEPKAAVGEAKTVEPKATTSPATSKAPKSGRQIYIAKCSACHSSDGSGAGTVGKSMRIPSLTSTQVQGKSDENLARVISNGAGKMPACKKKCSTEQIQLLVAYIRDLGKKH